MSLPQVLPHELPDLKPYVQPYLKRTDYQSVRFGLLQTLGVPICIVQDCTIQLNTPSLCVYIALLYAYKSMQKKDRRMYPAATVTIRQGAPDTNQKGKSLSEITGYSRPEISRALKHLAKIGWVQITTNLKMEERDRKGRLKVQRYTLYDPRPLNSPARIGGLKGFTWIITERLPLPSQDASLLFSNSIPYLTVPACIFTEQDARWSFAKMRATVKRLYIAVLWLANKHRKNRFQITGEGYDSDKQYNLRHLSKLSPKAFEDALDTLEELRLIECGSDLTTRSSSSKSRMVIELCDPFTGTILDIDGDDEDNPQNYRVAVGSSGKGRTRMKGVNFNFDLHDPQAVEHFIRNGIGYKGPIKSSSENLYICCPFHDDSDPSLSIALNKLGCWNCKACKDKTGNLVDLMKAFSKLPDSPIEFHLPDSKAIASYSYKNASGYEVRRKLRFPDFPNGDQHWTQFQIKNGVRVYNLKGVAPMLYNLDKLQLCYTVIICEGEKDANTINTLNLKDENGHDIVGTTSGGADTWRDELAEDLKDKRVILLSDNDQPGLDYEKAVKESLHEHRIEYVCRSNSLRSRHIEERAVKDVTEFMETHTVEQLICRINTRRWLPLPVPVAVYEDEPVAL
jgi:5S rRNA maturation endonuclease (ribonuclease M5)